MALEVLPAAIGLECAIRVGTAVGTECLQHVSAEFNGLRGNGGTKRKKIGVETASWMTSHT
jgi:hypothetical protein